MGLSLQHLFRYENEGEDMLYRMGASLPTRIKACFSAMDTFQSTFSLNQKCKVMLSAEKVMVTVFWDYQGVLLAHFQNRGKNVNSASSCEVLLKFGMQFAENIQANWQRGTAHHDNARPHTARGTQERIQELQWELLEHPPYNPDLAPSDFHLFVKLKNHLADKSFADEEEVKTEVRSGSDNSQHTSMLRVSTHR
jgi:histone-lysine N-methyltransferase SETMAR